MTKKEKRKKKKKCCAKKKMKRWGLNRNPGGGGEKNVVEKTGKGEETLQPKIRGENRKRGIW